LPRVPQVLVNTANRTNKSLNNSNCSDGTITYDPGGFGNRGNRKIVYDPGGDGFINGEVDSAGDDGDNPGSDIHSDNNNRKCAYNPGDNYFDNDVSSDRENATTSDNGSNSSTKVDPTCDDDGSTGGDTNDKNEYRRFVYDPGGDPCINSKRKCSAMVLPAHGIDPTLPLELAQAVCLVFNAPPICLGSPLLFNSVADHRSCSFQHVFKRYFHSTLYVLLWTSG